MLYHQHLTGGVLRLREVQWSAKVTQPEAGVVRDSTTGSPTPEEALHFLFFLT